MISDSGTITEESAILDFPAITIRETHERPEGMDEGTLVMSGLDSDSVLRSVETVIAHANSSGRSFACPSDYEAIDVSRKVVRTILSYTSYVNRVVWSKSS